MNATFKGLVTSGATGAAATALGTALAKLGMPLLNGGKPYAYCMFAYGPGWDKKTKAGTITGGANGPFVIYSPPRTQTSPATIWISVYPPGQPNIGGSAIGHALSFGFAVDPKALGMGAPGNTGAGHNISIGDFTWLSRTPPLPKSAATLNQRLRNIILPTRNANSLVMKQVTVGGSVSPGAGINTASGAGWVGVAAGSSIVFGPAGPDQQKTAANKLIASNAPTISAAFWVAPPNAYYNFNWKTWVEKPAPKSPVAPPPVAKAPPFVAPPPFVDPGEVPPAGKTPPVTNLRFQPWPNYATNGLSVEMPAGMQSKYGKIDYVQLFDRSGKVISTSNPAVPAAAVNVDLRGKPAVYRIRAVTTKGIPLNFMLSGLGTTKFGVDRSAAAQKINAEYGKLGAYTDSRLGWNRISIGGMDRKISQPSAVFHVVPPANAKPGTLRIEGHYYSAANRVQHQVLIDNDSRDLDRNPAVIKRDTRQGRGVLVKISYISKVTGKPVNATVSISEAGQWNSRVSATGIALNSAKGPKVYFNNFNSHTVYLGDMP